MNEKKLKAAFLISGIFFYSLSTLFIWHDRFYYDDEWINLRIISEHSYSGIITFISRFDFHPPFQYLINKIFYQLFGPNEWLMSIPGILSTGLSAGLIGIIVYEFSRSKFFSFLTILLASVHPSVQMWGWSIRWYPVWTFLIILSFYFSLRIWEKRFSIRNSAFMALALILSIYINYQTIAVLFSLIITAFFTDSANRNFRGNKFYNTNTGRTILVSLAVILFFLPWIGVFEFHLGNYFIQKNLLKDFINLGSPARGAIFLFTVFFGNSIYPWDIVFIICFGIILLAGIISGALFLLVKRNNPAVHVKINQSLLPLLIFPGVIVSLLFLSGIFSGSLPNNGNILIPFLLAMLAGISLFFLFKKVKNESGKEIYLRRLIKISLIVFIILNCYGTLNVIRRVHFHKMGLSDPIPEIVNLLESRAEEDADHKIILTIDPVLTYYLMKSNPAETEIISPYMEEAPAFLKENYFRKNYGKKSYDKYRLKLFFVESYMGSLISRQKEYKLISDYIKNNGFESEAPVYFNEDRDLFFKKRIFPRAGLPKYRFKISFFKPAPGWDTIWLDRLKKIGH